MHNELTKPDICPDKAVEPTTSEVSDVNREYLEVKQKQSPFLLNNSFQYPPKTFKVERSTVLDKVKQFLPKINAENASLTEKMKNKPSELFDIEHLHDPDGAHISMDIGFVPQMQEVDSSDDSSDSDSESEDNDAIQTLMLKLNKQKKKNIIANEHDLQQWSVDFSSFTVRPVPAVITDNDNSHELYMLSNTTQLIILVSKVRNCHVPGTMLFVS